MFGGAQTGTPTYQVLRPDGTTFYQSEITLLLPPKFPGFFPKWKTPKVTQIVMDGLFHPFHFVEKKIILNTLGKIARSYELYIRGEEEFFTVPTVFD